MPYPNEHACRLQDPAKFDKFRRTSGGKLYNKINVPKTISIIWGHSKGQDDNAWAPQALRFPKTKWTADEAKKWLKDNEVKGTFEAAAEEGLEGRFKRYLAEAEVSHRSWAEIDKAKLPKDCFLWVEDPDKKTTWHLPYREGTGGIDSATGMYKKAGAINVGAVRAILEALGGARTGKPMRVPAEVKKKAYNIAKQLRIGTPAEEVLKKGGKVGVEFINEQAVEAIEVQDIRDVIQAIVDKKWDNKYYVCLVGVGVVLIENRISLGMSGNSSIEREQFIVHWALIDGEIAIPDTEPKPVKLVYAFKSE